MPKLKTNKAAKKRYSLTATGKVKRTKSNRRHLLANKTKRQKKSGKILFLNCIRNSFIRRRKREKSYLFLRISMTFMILQH